jgi:hypothetical protein
VILSAAYFPIANPEKPTMGAIQTSFESTIAQWHGIRPPNDPAKRLAAELADTIAAFEALRGTLVFEDEPSSFDAALQATKDTA